MKNTICIFTVLVLIIFALGSCEEWNIDLPRSVVISERDTVTFSRDTIIFPQDTARLRFLSKWYLDTLTLPADTVWKDTLTIYKDTLYADTLYADTLRLTKVLFEHDELVRDIRDEIITAYPDTTNFYRVEFSGISKADEIRVVPNCFDGSQNEKYSVLLAIQDSLADNYLPTNVSLKAGEHFFRHITPDTLDCRGVMTYWITAKLDTQEVLGVKFTDIGQRLFVGKNQ